MATVTSLTVRDSRKYMPHVLLCLLLLSSPAYAGRILNATARGDARVDTCNAAINNAKQGCVLGGEATVVKCECNQEKKRGSLDGKLEWSCLALIDCSE